MSEDLKNLARSAADSILGIAIPLLVSVIIGYFRLPKIFSQMFFFLLFFLFIGRGAYRLCPVSAKRRRVYAFFLSAVAFVFALIVNRQFVIWELKYFQIWSGMSLVITTLVLVLFFLCCGGMLYLRGRKKNSVVPLYLGIFFWQMLGGLLLSGLVFFMFWIVAGIKAIY